MTLVEIALDDVAGARIAEQAGAGRIELCNALADGGITPSIGLVREVAARLTIPLMLLIRPRAGDFVYSEQEVQVMLSDIESLRSAAPSAGFVVGALEASGAIDVEASRRLVDACGDAPVTFHKAFDSTRDLSSSLETVIDLGVQRVLTSGGRRTALEGASVLRTLVEQAGGRVTIMAGGAIRAENAGEVVSSSGVTEVHLQAAVQRPSVNSWSNPEQGYDAASVTATDPGVVRGVVAELANLAMLGKAGA
ncbi:copper homeostasis protein CutC [Glaciihabitans sp. UYNi722]|uniref:copper homeostasis protein CutC n=1 Tax=Glaciihabitans sp. UYNi722 TaxID=3156344 RepID=UPI0033970772